LIKLRKCTGKMGGWGGRERRNSTLDMFYLDAYWIFKWASPGEIKRKGTWT
jgi:hypothetical protein